jgi:crotonobetainyl-CoA:carnitine CoA-transferase CaiB-like acyl-CoA transferase
MEAMFEGVRILDLSAVISGPMATAMLADQGAEVIKVEPPELGDMTRHLGAQRGGVSAMFATVNRNKRSLVLDLKEPAGIEALKRVAARCDAVVQNFRPGAAERMGLGYEDLRAVREDLVYLSISGFGRHGPYAHRRVYDPVMQTVTGMAAAQGAPGGEPVMVRTLVCDKATALTAAQALAAALFARERTGRGRHLELSMLDASLWFHWPDLYWNHTFVGDDAERHPDLADLFAVSRTADGWIAAITDGSVDFSGMTTAAALALLDEADAPCAPVNDLDAVLDDPQVRASGALFTTEHPAGGVLRQPRPPVRDGAEGADFVRHPAPALGVDGAAILAESGLPAAEIDALRAAGVLH